MILFPIFTNMKWHKNTFFKPLGFGYRLPPATCYLLMLSSFLLYLCDDIIYCSWRGGLPGGRAWGGYWGRGGDQEQGDPRQPMEEGQHILETFLGGFKCQDFIFNGGFIFNGALKSLLDLQTDIGHTYRAAVSKVISMSSGSLNSIQFICQKIHNIR